MSINIYLFRICDSAIKNLFVLEDLISILFDLHFSYGQAGSFLHMPAQRNYLYIYIYIYIYIDR